MNADCILSHGRKKPEVSEFFVQCKRRYSSLNGHLYCLSFSAVHIQQCVVQQVSKANFNTAQGFTFVDVLGQRQLDNCYFSLRLPSVS